MKLNKFLKGILPTIALTGGVIATTVSCNVVKKDAEKKPETPKKDTQTASDKTQDASVKKEFTFEKLKVSGKDVKFGLKVKNKSTLTLGAGEKLFLTIVVNKLNEKGESAKQEKLTLQGEKVEGQEGFGVKDTFTFKGVITDAEIVKGQKFFQIESLKKGSDTQSATMVNLTQENTDVEFLN